MAENIFFYESKVMWSQVDANMHLRHSAYADFAAQTRLDLLETLGFGVDVFQELQIGPILFREELIYFREVKLNDRIKVSCELSKLSENKSRWSFKQELYRGDGVKAAVIHVDGAWLDLKERKLTVLPAYLIDAFSNIARSSEFKQE